MILLTGLYNEMNPSRRAELRECLRRNAENEFIELVVVFNEDTHPPEIDSVLSLPKIKLVQHDRRVTFKDLFDYANLQLNGTRAIIANADIFFDHTLARLNGYSLLGKLLCLSRWDVQPDGSANFFEHPSSQDAWIFETPIAEFKCDFQMGMLGCDNRLAWEADHAGLELSNPGRTVRANHLHVSLVRNYTEQQRLHGPSKSIEASTLETPFPSLLGPPPDMPCAAAVFSETMGYTVETLQPGVSSHNNIHRPFNMIPEVLAGRMYTQVVAYNASPVAVEFLTAGKVYVLVGDDWYGHGPVTDWLNDNGYKENVPSVKTEAGPGFEVWSLAGEEGQRFVIPTQVMLVSDSLVRGRDFSSGKTPRKSKESIFALTSLSPHQSNPDHTRKCLESWRRAGLEIRSFNHPAEISELTKLFDIEFVPVEETTIQTFGAHFIPINTLLQWAGDRDMPALFINSDIELRFEPWEMKRIRWLTEDGLCYFVRFNYEGDYDTAVKEWDGMDAFLLHGRQCELFQPSFLSMGKPYWDYWLPYTFHANSLPIYTVEFPASFHLKHHNRWSWTDWHTCAVEFQRIIGERHPVTTFDACNRIAHRERDKFDQQKVLIPQKAPVICQWVEEKFRAPGPKTFIELGSHCGMDTAWMAAIPGVSVYALEPDPRNHQQARQNVMIAQAAVADFNGRGLLTLSAEGWGREWTFSSSIKQPLNHLSRYPVTFGNTVEVEMTTLDSFCDKHQLGVIDFIFADVQGAEAEMIRGGRKTLARTRYLFTEYSDDELYAKQPALSEILAMLPDFRVVELWPDDVLLENTRFQG
jgi:FkbM family methyltransferase